MQRLLIVDDEPAVRRALVRMLDRYQVDAAATTEEARVRLSSSSYALIITDLRMPGADGFEVIKAARVHQPTAPVIMLTGHGSIADAVTAMRCGAHNFISKPVHPEQLNEAVAEALSGAADAPTAPDLAPADGAAERVSLIGSRMSGVLDLVGRVADHDATVLLTGESGTGKEVVARLLHTSSGRATGPFVAVNCGAIPEALIESELFGHAKGAFTGAVERRVGKFALADGGTLFLDEIGDLPLALQVKLVRVLQEREICPVGDATPRRVDVRVVAATLRDLEQMVEQGEFREDLYYRLNVVPISLPPLRVAPDDVVELAHHFLERANARFRRSVQLSPLVLAAMRSHGWPGNVRELKNLIDRLVLTVPGQAVAVADLPPKLRQDSSCPPTMAGQLEAPLSDGGVDLPRALAEIERQMIDEALRATDGNKARAAALLNIKRTTLVQKLRRQLAEHDRHPVDGCRGA